MNESYTLLFKEKKGLCVVLPSLSISEKSFKEKIKNPGKAICLVFYSGFGKSEGSFPGSHILKNIDTLITGVQDKTGKKVDNIIGDSYGGLIALGLLARYRTKYKEAKFILTSPLISFDRLEKNPKSPQSKEGFIRYLRGHESINKISKNQLVDLVKHKEISDPFKSKILGRNVTIYHYEGDHSLDYRVSKEFSKSKGTKIVKLNGVKHALANFDKKTVGRILA